MRQRGLQQRSWRKRSWRQRSSYPRLRILSALRWTGQNRACRCPPRRLTLRWTGQPIDEALSLPATLTVWKRNFGCFGIYSLILIVIYLVWARASLVIFALFYQGGMPTLGSFMTQILKFDNIEFLLAYFAVGGFFAMLVFAVSVVSIPMMLERNKDTITAMLASFLALVRNLPMMLIWGALIALLTALGIALGFIGLIITMPLVGHATWHAYRALIEPPAP